MMFKSQKDIQVQQVGVVSGGLCKQMDKPSVYGRLEDYEVLQFIYKNAFGRNIPVQYSKLIPLLMAKNSNL